MRYATARESGSSESLRVYNFSLELSCPKETEHMRKGRAPVIYQAVRQNSCLSFHEPTAQLSVFALVICWTETFVATNTATAPAWIFGAFMFFLAPLYQLVETVFAVFDIFQRPTWDGSGPYELVEEPHIAESKFLSPIFSLAVRVISILNV